MESAREKPKILLLRKARHSDAAGRDPWSRIVKALGAFCDLVVEEHAEFSGSGLEKLAPWSQVFVDAALPSWKSFTAARASNLTFVFLDDFPWADFRADPHLEAVLRRFPSFSQQDMAASDILRFLYLYLQPKRLAGVTALSDKSAVIIGEKLQSLNGVGALVDKASAYLEQVDGFQLKNRLLDLRLVLPALLFEAFRCARVASQDFPTVDFQFSASAQRVAINLRFPHGDLDLARLREQIFSRSRLCWQQIWDCSDQLLLVEHQMHTELEVSVLIFRAERPAEGGPRTLLYKTLDRSARKEDYLDPPEGYEFQILSDLRLRGADSIEEAGLSADEVESGIDFGSLPEDTARKLKDILRQARKREEEVAYKDQQFQAAKKRNQELEKALGSKRAEALHLLKLREGDAVSHERELRELRKQLATHEANAPAQSAQAAAAQVAAKDTSAKEMLSKMEFALKQAEEKTARIEADLKKEGRLVTLMEDRLKAANQEVRKKDEEIFALKAINLNLRKEPEKAAQKPSAGSEGVAAELQTKLKAAEAKEAALQKEIRGLNFKVEAHDKNVKVIQEASAEKNRLMEEKLQQAKAKEVELRKKIDELTAMLRKAKVA